MYIKYVKNIFYIETKKNITFCKITFVKFAFK